MANSENESVWDVLGEARLGATGDMPFAYRVGLPDEPEIIDVSTKKIIKPRAIRIKNVTLMSHPGDKRDERRVTGTNEPVKTVTTRNNTAIVQPLVLGQQGNAACRPIDEPCPTIACAGAIRGIFPKLADGRIIDIRMRMLRPDELAAAHSFPKDYIITGNRSQKVKQIGNSVPVRTAKAMCAADLPRKDAKC